MAMPSQLNQSSAEAAAIQEFGERLVKLRECLSMNNDRIERVLSRAFGEGPTGPAGSSPRAIPSGEVGTVRDRLDDLSSLLNAQSTLLNRVDTIV